MTALTIRDAVAAHQAATSDAYAPLNGRRLQRVLDKVDDAFDVLLGTPAGDIQGAKDLLAYLRNWLKEAGPEAGDRSEAFYIAQARAADLEMLLFAPTAGEPQS